MGRVARKVQCIDNGQVFDNAAAAAEFAGVSSSTMAGALSPNGITQGKAGGKTFKWVTAPADAAPARRASKRKSRLVGDKATKAPRPDALVKDPHRVVGVGGLELAVLDAMTDIARGGVGILTLGQISIATPKMKLELPGLEVRRG